MHRQYKCKVILRSWQIGHTLGNCPLIKTDNYKVLHVGYQKCKCKLFNEWYRTQKQRQRNQFRGNYNE